MRLTAASMPSSRASVVSVFVGSSVASRTVTPSTAATATFVPPTSTPRTIAGVLSPQTPNKQARLPGIHPDGSARVLCVGKNGRMSPPRRRLVGGLDLGGTKIQAVILDGRRSVIGEARSATPTTDGAQDVILALVSTLGSACADAGVEVSDLAGVGVGSPGAIDTRRGVVTGARNLPGEGAPIPIAAGFKTLAGTRAYVDNDVTVGVNAEYVLGAATALEVAARRVVGHRRRRRDRAARRALGGPRRSRRARARGRQDRRRAVHLRPPRVPGGLRRARRHGDPGATAAQARAQDRPVQDHGEARAPAAHLRGVGACARARGRAGHRADRAGARGARSRHRLGREPARRGDRGRSAAGSARASASPTSSASARRCSLTCS